MANYFHSSVSRSGYLNEVFLENEYMSIGIGSNGAHGTTVNAPAGFHPVNRQTIGLSINQAGFSSGKAPTTGDFFLPGAPEERFTIGLNNNTTIVNVCQSTAQISPLSISDDSNDQQLKCTWTGRYSNMLDVTLVYTLGPFDKYFSCTVQMTNIGTAAINNLRFIRSVDPDPDADLSSNYNTINTIELQNPTDGQAFISAKGASTGTPFSYYSDDPRAMAGTNFGVLYPTDAYTAGVRTLAKGYTESADKGICISIEEPVLAPGQTTSFTYYCSLAASAQDAINEIRSGFTLNAQSQINITPSLTAATTVQIPLAVASLQGKRTTPITANYRTLSDTAVDGMDFTGVSGQVSFPAGTDLVNLLVPISKTRETGGSKKFYVDLSNVSGARMLNSRATVNLKYNSVPAPQVDILSAQNSLFYKNYKLRIGLTPAQASSHVGTLTGAGQTLGNFDSASKLDLMTLEGKPVTLSKGVNTFYLNFSVPSFSPIAINVTPVEVKNKDNFNPSKLFTGFLLGELAGKFGSPAALLQEMRKYDSTLGSVSMQSSSQQAFNYFASLAS